MMSKTRQWLALGGAAVLAVLGLGWFLVISPTRGEAAELVAQTEQQQAQTAMLTSQLHVLRAQAAELPAQQARLGELQEELPETAALPDLIRLLTVAADETGVELSSMAPSASVASGDIAEVPFTLVVEGGYFNLEQFLGALEDLPRAFVVGSFSLAPKGEDPTALELSLNGKVFTKQMPAGAAAAPGAAGGAASTGEAPAAVDGGATETEVAQPATSTS
jgi:Tfp pilus assembly protein PilO